jgi:hypothetical protein
MYSESPWVAHVELPGGLVLDGNRCLRKAALRPLNGREEEWLAEGRNLPSAVKVTRVLNSCLVSLDKSPVTGEMVRSLLVGDREYLMLRLREMTLGDDVKAVLHCPVCSQRMDLSFRISETPVEERRQTAAAYSVGLGKRSVRFRLPSGGDQEAVLAMEASAATSELLRRCILDDGGWPLSEEDREAVTAEMERLAPRVELELDAVCPECNHAFVAPFDTTAFFFEEMRTSRDQLLREFHALAFYYHWSENDILNLGRDRRRTYLGLLSEALRQD